MTEISEILYKSIYLLVEEPELFLPKLLSTFLSSLWILGAITGYLTNFQMLLSFPFVMVSGVFVSLMVASMVKNRDSEKILKKGFVEAYGSWKAILPAALFFLVTGFVVVIPLGIGLTYYLQFGNIIALFAGVAASLTLIIGVSFYSYFLPITMLEKKSFSSGLRESMQSSRKSSKTVLSLTLFSIILLVVAFTSSEYLQALGYLGFLVGRLLATTVNTYLFVVSPSYYLSQD